MSELEAQESSQEAAEKTQTIDWASVEIPLEVIKEQTAYQEVLSESIARRKEIKELKTQLKPTEVETTETVTQPASEPQIDVDTITAKIMEGLAGKLDRLEQVAKTVEQREVEVRVNKLASTYNLSPDDTEFMKSLGVEQQEAFAKRVGKKVEDSKFAGDGGKENGENRLLKRFQANHRTSDDPTDTEAFNPDFHRNKDGGPVVHG